MVAPLLDSTFNKCKTAIKWLEACALGIPLFASRMLPYFETMPDQQMFSTQEELKDKLEELKFCSVGAYGKIVQNQWNFLNSPRKEGDCQLRDSWLEDNLESTWIPTMRIKMQR